MLAVSVLEAFAGIAPSAAASQLWYRIDSVRYVWNHKLERTFSSAGTKVVETSKVVWKGHSPPGESPLIQRLPSGRLIFSGASFEGKLIKVIHKGKGTWKPHAEDGCGDGDAER